MTVFQLSLIICLLLGVNSIVDRTYFNYLGLKISASSQDIKAAYQTKLAKVNAIENQEERSKKLKLLNDAYETLSNENERSKYQRYGKDIFKTIKEPTNINKMNPENPTDTRKSLAFKLTVPVSIYDVYNGAVIKAKYPKNSACPICQGTGAASPKDLTPCSSCGGKGFSVGQTRNFYGQNIKIENVCPVCKGQGKIVTKSCSRCKGTRFIKEQATIEFKIPKGLPNGNKITFRNYGEEVLHGAPSDFQVTVVQIPTKQWSRQDFNLIYRMEISLEQAIFGFEKTFLHLSGEELKVSRLDQVTTKDTKYTIKGKGLVNKQGYLGNLQVKFKIIIPKFNEDQLIMWEDFFDQHDM